jgi:hypothetical protein
LRPYKSGCNSLGIVGVSGKILGIMAAKTITSLRVEPNE